MRNYYQIKTVASAPPRRLIPIGKVFSATGLVIGNCRSLFRSVIECQHIWFAFFSFLALWLVLFLDGLLLVITASKQQEKLLGIRQSLLENDPQIVASAEEFMAQQKALTQQGEITGIFIVHNATKNLYYVGQSAKAIDRAAIQFLGRGNCDVYADYKYGDSFNVRIIPLSGSGYESLNELKRTAIQALEAAGEELY
ncbi:hypothetical protein DW661_09610 [Collinsella sp. AM24-1]|uniref:hypothetical protein n=1 Tax=Collinsella sp. AM24-1 TaxID=2292031 RepID=UPI000E5878B4|nr:hypothetical protein [Collinsella sp. AM24-1]RHF70014.1 hypothetical protein DW661_09610 [Collinsella sp. AM24-1]